MLPYQCSNITKIEKSNVEDRALVVLLIDLSRRIRPR